ncbi:hypothetical protein CSKR_109714, partial [Clonorchis sinensis]
NLGSWIRLLIRLLFSSDDDILSSLMILDSPLWPNFEGLHLGPYDLLIKCILNRNFGLVLVIAKSASSQLVRSIPMVYQLDVDRLAKNSPSVGVAVFVTLHVGLQVGLDQSRAIGEFSEAFRVVSFRNSKAVGISYVGDDTDIYYSAVDKKQHLRLREYVIDWTPFDSYSWMVCLTSFESFGCCFPRCKTQRTGGAHGAQKHMNSMSCQSHATYRVLGIIEFWNGANLSLNWS